MESLNTAVNCFIDITNVSKITSLGKSTIRLWEAEGRFPKSIKLSLTKRVWLESEINDWMLSKLNAAKYNSIIKNG